MSNRTPIIAGNWKMHKTHQEAATFVAEIQSALANQSNVEVVLCAPFTALSAIADALKGTDIRFGAQNVHFEEKGAYTGEIAPSMLQALGCKYVIIGHSERRQYFQETDEIVNKKVLAVLRAGLLPILCVGEDLAQRESGQTNQIVATQTVAGLQGLTPEQVQQVVIAYEPIWAIGTGKSSSAEDANEVIAHIRATIREHYGDSVAEKVRIQYGGSVKPENIATYLQQMDIDGALVGGASLEPVSFIGLIQAIQS